MRIEPPRIAPLLNSMVGAMSFLSIFALVEEVEENEGAVKTNIVNRAEYITVKSVATRSISKIIEFVCELSADSIIVSLE